MPRVPSKPISAEGLGFNLGLFTAIRIDKISTLEPAVAPHFREGVKGLTSIRATTGLRGMALWKAIGAASPLGATTLDTLGLKGKGLFVESGSANAAKFLQVAAGYLEFGADRGPGNLEGKKSGLRESLKVMRDLAKSVDGDASRVAEILGSPYLPAPNAHPGVWTASLPQEPLTLGVALVLNAPRTSEPMGLGSKEQAAIFADATRQVQVLSLGGSVQTQGTAR